MAFRGVTVLFDGLKMQSPILLPNFDIWLISLATNVSVNEGYVESKYIIFKDINKLIQP